MRWEAAFIITISAASAASGVIGCGGGSKKASPDATPTATCTSPPADPALGSTTGHAQPLLAGPTEARAGRIHDGDLPSVPGAMVTWATGDFVLANDKVAIVIEDVGPSDLYDPWGGRPVGMSLMSGGKMVSPANFGELFLLTGHSTVMTEHVTVINDGTDGKPAVIRASGHLAPLPFFDSITSGIWHDKFTDISAAIDYSLAPGAEAVDVTYRYESPRASDAFSGVLMHGFMYTKRTPSLASGTGFTDQLNDNAYLAEIDDGGASWAYSSADGTIGSGVSAAGFVSGFTAPFTITACSETVHKHAHIVIGGPGLDGLVQAVARDGNQSLRAITGTITRGGAPAAGVRVHATEADGTYLTRTTTATDGTYTLHVPATAAVHLTTFKRGDVNVETDLAATDTAHDFALAPNGQVHVTITDGSGPLPARVQLLPAGGQTIPSVPDNYGEPAITDGRLQVDYAVTGDTTLPAPPGAWRVVVSRGYEYDLHDETVTVTAGATAQIAATLTRVVDTTGVQCGDFHIHTARSNDSGDDSLQKIASAVADGLEIPVRTDHEYVGTFAGEIAALGVQKWAYPIASIEMTSFQLWGHMGVFPLVPDPTQPNAGAPTWQSWPTATTPDVKLATLSPKSVFDTVRARPEQPAIIINHPRGGNTDYFNYVGFDPATGAATDTADWDPQLRLVEVFNSSDWVANKDGTVADWLSLLSHGYTVFATGSSDSHGISSSPVGYPRTCISLGTDDPTQLTPNQVRDQLAAGHATISGGLYVTAKVGAAGPGDTATGLGTSAMLDIQVQAAPWVDATSIEVVVDGATTMTIPIAPSTSVVRYHQQVPISVAAAGSYVIVAAYGAQPLEPVHPGRIPFGTTNPIFLRP